MHTQVPLGPTGSPAAAPLKRKPDSKNLGPARPGPPLRLSVCLVTAFPEATATGLLGAWMDAAQRGVTASRREGGGGKTVTSAQTLWGFPGCSVTCTSESARPASAAMRCVHAPQIKAAEGEGGTCGRDDEPPISLSIVGGIQKGRLFYFQTCRRKKPFCSGAAERFMLLTYLEPRLPQRCRALMTGRGSWGWTWWPHTANHRVRGVRGQPVDLPESSPLVIWALLFIVKGPVHCILMYFWVVC